MSFFWVWLLPLVDLKVGIPFPAWALAVLMTTRLATPKPRSPTRHFTVSWFRYRMEWIHEIYGMKSLLCWLTWALRNALAVFKFDALFVLGSICFVIAMDARTHLRWHGSLATLTLLDLTMSGPESLCYLQIVSLFTTFQMPNWLKNGT